jgi:SAM-dependent methyltransferase
MTRDIRHALSFGKAVGDYDRGRPGYPDDAVDWLLDHAPARPAVLDVGAGTGKFTASLAARGLEVTAVDPDPGMLARLAENLPGVGTAEGSAESLPVEAGSADLVTLAQAWHWVDSDAASREVARVLRPGGVLGLIWNIRDEGVEWVRALSEVMGASEAERFDSITPPVGESLERAGFAEFRWQNRMTRAELLAMVTSRSYVITMADDERRAMLARLETVLDTHPHLAGHTEYDMPYLTRVTVARRA